MRPGENTDDDIDALITTQHEVDDSRFSYSVAHPSSSRAPAVLSDREFTAPKSRRDDLVDGYRRIKRARPAIACAINGQ